MRDPGVRLKAIFSTVPGVFGAEQTCELKIAENRDQLYPGLLVQLVRRDNAEPLLPVSEFFDDAQAEIRAPGGIAGEYADYPAWRTAESIHPLDDTHLDKPRFQKPRFQKPQFKKPWYHHTVIPSLRFFTDPEEAKSHRAPTRHLLGDLRGLKNSTDTVSARIQGVFMVDSPGVYQFRLETTQPARLSIGGKTLEIAEPPLTRIPP